MIREWVHRRWIAFRRWRLLAAYARVFKRRTGKSVGFSPYLYALQEAEDDGLLEVTDGDVEWDWPGGEHGSE